MKAIKIYTQEGKYFMEDLDTNVTTELTNPKHVKKDNTDWFTLPENSCNRQCVCKQTIDRKIEITYGEKTPRTLNTEKSTTTKKSTPKFDPEKYLTEKLIEKRRKLLEEVAKIDAIAEAEYLKEKQLEEMTEALKKFTPEMVNALMENLNKKEEAKA